jgi:hypothetical protein
MTAQDIIYVALRSIGVLRTGQTPSADALVDSLSALNSMLDSWSTENLMLPVEARALFPLTASQQTYLMGPGGDWNTARPSLITSIAFVINSVPATEYPLDMLSDEDWREVFSKGITTSQPTAAHLENTPTQMSIDLWPVPSANGTVAVYSSGPLTTFADLNSTQYTFQPGYDLALKYCLAETVWPLFVGPQLKNEGASFSEVVRMAAEYKRRVKVRNIQPITMTTDAALSGRGRYWIYSDTTVGGNRR